jgi:cell division protein FtsW (lipid II flippase)
VQPDAIGLVAPALLLAVIGDLIAYRLRLTAPASVPPASGATAIAAVAIFAAAVGAIRDVARLERIAYPLGLTGLALTLAPIVPGLGIERGHARAWAQLPGGVAAAPGEIGRPLLAVGVAALLARVGPWISTLTGTRLTRSSARAVVAVGAIPVAAALLLLLENDLGPAAVVILATGLMVTLVTGRMRFLVLAGTGLTLALGAGFVLSERLRERVLDVTQPLRDHGGHGLGQAGLAHLGAAWGGWTGTGLGGGLAARGGAIPAQGTDYVLSFWTQEMGLIGLFLVLGLLAAVVVAAWRRARLGRAGFDVAAAAGLAAILTVHTLWVCAAVCGFVPLTGIVTPLVSGGGSARIGMALTLALLVCTRTAHSGVAKHARPDLRLDGATARRFRLMSIASAGGFALIGAGAAYALRSSAATDAARPDNPFAAWAALDRGEIVSADGAKLAWTTGAGSLDRVRRHYRTPLGLERFIGAADASVGESGVERAWSDTLRCGGASHCRPASIRLTLDLGLQRAARTALGERFGAVAVLDARTGAILSAFGRTPADGTDGAAVDLALAPGSVFKIIAAVAALDEGSGGETPQLGGYQAVGGPWLRNAGGMICGGSLEHALAVSCNSSFALLAHRVGSARVLHTAALFGFEAGGTLEVSGIPLPRGSALGGATPASMDDTLLAATAIGQGRVTATPLQMAVAYSAIANGGVLARPHLATGGCGRGVSDSREALRRVASTRTAARIGAGMRQAVTGGTASLLSGTPGGWAAKTGTAEVPALEQPRSPAGTAGWIVGFSTEASTSRDRPVPIIVALVLPDSDDHLRTGGIDAAAVLARVARATAGWRPRGDGCPRENAVRDGDPTKVGRGPSASQRPATRAVNDHFAGESVTRKGVPAAPVPWARG